MRYLDEVSINTLFNFANLKGRSVYIPLRSGASEIDLAVADQPCTRSS